MRVILTSFLYIICSLATLILGIIGGEFKAAHGALVVSPQPLRNAFLVEKMTAWQFAGFILQILAADWAARVLFVGARAFTVFICNFNFRKFLDNLFAGRWCARSASVHLWKAQDVLHYTLIVKEWAEVQVQIAKQTHTLIHWAEKDSSTLASRDNKNTLWALGLLLLCLSDRVLHYVGCSPLKNHTIGCDLLNDGLVPIRIHNDATSSDCLTTVVDVVGGWSLSGLWFTGRGSGRGICLLSLAEKSPETQQRGKEVLFFSSLSGLFLSICLWCCLSCGGVNSWGLGLSLLSGIGDLWTTWGLGGSIIVLAHRRKFFDECLITSGAFDLNEFIYWCHLLKLSLAHVAHVGFTYHAVLLVSRRGRSTAIGVRLVLFEGWSMTAHLKFLK